MNYFLQSEENSQIEYPSLTIFLICNIVLIGIKTVENNITINNRKTITLDLCVFSINFCINIVPIKDPIIELITQYTPYS